VKSCLPEAIKFVDFNEAVLHWKAVKVGSMPAPFYQQSQGFKGFQEFPGLEETELAST
jgi:hypothetical protein